jgi:hypothetical protein
MKKLTFMQAVELIDIAANENRLWHYNGGQAYIRVSDSSNVLMVIDHTLQSRVPEITHWDGTQYFAEYTGAQFRHSETRRNGEPLVEFFKTKFTDIIELETV